MHHVTIPAELTEEKKDRSAVVYARRKNIVEGIAAVFILLFMYTALSKTVFIGPTVDVLRITPYVKGFPLQTAWAVVGAEYLAALLLFIPRTRKTGLISSLILMLGFIGYIIWMQISAPSLPCSCGGVISDLTWNQHLIFNIGFALLAVVGIVLMNKQKKLH
jgi:hypothetical protein